MAPIGENDKSNVFDEESDEVEQNLWATILDEVQSSSANKLPSCKNLLVLGENESGKTTLLAKLQSNEDPKKGSGLEYTYINVKDEYREDQTRLGVWILDGDLHHSSLLRYALPRDSLPHTLVMLVASMTQPWSLLETLERWAAVLTAHIDRLKLDPQDRAEREQDLVRQFQQYEEPGVEGETPKRKSKADEEQVLLPLGETTLTRNLGIPIIVVITKSDAISTLEKEHEYREERFDFVQKSLRKFCLKYGASLFYTSVKEDKNCELLLRYMLHLIYGFPFNTPAFVVERDSVFVPSGWDTENKISILYESMTTIKPDDAYEDVISKPITRKAIQRELEIAAEDEQVFLMKQDSILKQMPQQKPADVGRPSPQAQISSPATPGRPAAANVGTSPGKKQTEAGKPGAAASEGVLANFFNSLLHKKTGGTPAATPKSTERTTVSRDAAAELDRMTRVKKPSSASTPSPVATNHQAPDS